MKTKSTKGLEAVLRKRAPDVDLRLAGAEGALRGGTIVRQMREAAGLSQGQLAERLGVEQPRISEIESGRGVQGPTTSLLFRVARACGVDLEFEYRARTSAQHEGNAPGVSVDTKIGHVVVERDPTQPSQTWPEFVIGQLAGRFPNLHSKSQRGTPGNVVKHLVVEIKGAREPVAMCYIASGPRRTFRSGVQTYGKHKYQKRGTAFRGSFPVHVEPAESKK